MTTIIPFHPPEFAKPTDRFVVMLQVGKKDGEPFFEPLAYGLPGQPDPESLLRRGRRATAFTTEQKARDALAASQQRWIEQGLTFHHGKEVRFLKVEAHDGQ